MGGFNSATIVALIVFVVALIFALNGTLTLLYNQLSIISA